MTENSNLPNREDKVRELLPDEREALIRALENDGTFPDGVMPYDSLFALELVWLRTDGVAGLTAVGHLLAVELRKGDRLERAQQKLKEWGPTVGQGAWLEWALADGAWTVYMKWSSDFRGEPGEACLRDFDPLTAVIEASRQTPWELEE